MLTNTQKRKLFDRKSPLNAKLANKHKIGFLYSKMLSEFGTECMNDANLNGVPLDRFPYTELLFTIDDAGNTWCYHYEDVLELNRNQQIDPRNNLFIHEQPDFVEFAKEKSRNAVPRPNTSRYLTADKKKLKQFLEDINRTVDFSDKLPVDEILNMTNAEMTNMVSFLKRLIQVVMQYLHHERFLKRVKKSIYTDDPEELEYEVPEVPEGSQSSNEYLRAPSPLVKRIVNEIKYGNNPDKDVIVQGLSVDNKNKLKDLVQLFQIFKDAGVSNKTLYTIFFL